MRTLSALTLVFAPALLWAAPAPLDKDDKSVSPAEQVRKALDRPLTIQIAKQPLSTAVEMLREKTGIHFVLDSLTIQQQLGFTPDQPPAPVEVDLKTVKARTVLRAVLATYGLDYAVIGDTVVITTEEAAVLRQMRQRVSVDLDKVELAAALKQIGRESGTNLILDSRVGSEAKIAVSLQIDDVPLETAARLLSEMAGLKAVRVGNTFFVTKKETAAEMRNDPDFNQPSQPVQASVYGNNTIGGIGTLGGALGGPVFVNPPALPPPPVPPTVPPAVGPSPAPPAVGPGPVPTPPSEPEAPPAKKEGT